MLISTGFFKLVYIVLFYWVFMMDLYSIHSSTLFVFIYSLESNYMQSFFLNIFATVHRINLFSPLLSEFEMWHFYAPKHTAQWDKSFKRFLKKSFA